MSKKTPLEILAESNKDIVWIIDENGDTVQTSRKDYKTRKDAGQNISYATDEQIKEANKNYAEESGQPLEDVENWDTKKLQENIEYLIEHKDRINAQDEVFKHLMKNNHFKTLSDTKEIYVYNGHGIYEITGEDIIQENINFFLDKNATTNTHKTIKYRIEAQTFTDRETATTHDWINLKNGLLNPETNEFIEHTPEIFTTAQIPIAYDPKADCPKFKEDLKKRVCDDVFKTTQEMFGYTLQPGQKYQKAFLLYGSRRSMKSTTLNILEKLLGKGNVCGYSLQELNDNKYAGVYLNENKANICADLDSKSLKSVSVFMRVTGTDAITSAKKFCHAITFHPTSKLIFSCNQIPATYNKDLAFYRRWILLSYPKQMKIEDVDVNAPKKYEEELSGILNWALEGLKRLQKQKGFTLQMSDEEIQDVYERNSNSIQSFIFNIIDTEDDTEALTKRETYACYEKYCEDNKIHIEHQHRFGKEFILLTGCGTRRLGLLPAYTGVRFKGGEGQTTI